MVLHLPLTIVALVLMSKGTFSSVSDCKCSDWGSHNVLECQLQKLLSGRFGKGIEAAEYIV